ncbi:arginine--tRNA ligase [Candidatus Falkowbacteria bacterium]|nr:arginine--tRNA ligase [Candidatus Falkowbacteria bacterium]
MNTLDKVKQNIVEAINAALKEKLVKASDLVYPLNPAFGDISLPCFNLAKELTRLRRQEKTAVEICEFLMGKIVLNDVVVAIKAIGPFLNFTFNKAKLGQEVIEEILKQKEKYGLNQNGKNKRIMVEFAHPNTHKAFHIGHLRNILTGEAIARILTANGYKIIRANYQGDVGLHIAKCLWGISRLKKEYQEVKAKPAEAKAGLLGRAYALGSKNYEENAEAKKEIIEINKKIYNQDKTVMPIYRATRKWSLDYFAGIYKKLDTKFDRLYFESEVFSSGREIVLRNLKKGVFKASRGAVIFEGEKYGLHSRVFINSEGNPTYEAKDMGLAELQFKEFRPEKILHVVGPEQAEYFKVIIKALEIIMPKTKGRETHLRYGWVRLKEGKMSSRLGNVVLGEWLLGEAKKEVLEIMKSARGLKNKAEVADKVSLAAVKYSILKNGPDKDIAFDLKESVSFNGSSGPYLQYTVARINSITRKSQIPNPKSQKNSKFKIQDLKLEDAKEQGLIVKLARYPEVLAVAGKNYDPSEIAKYLFELAQEFNDYYHSVRILKAKTDISLARLSLIMAVKQALENGLGLLGIETVEKM